MKIHFKSRNHLRQFASVNGKKQDQGAQAKAGERWAFVVNRRKV